MSSEGREKEIEVYEKHSGVKRSVAFPDEKMSRGSLHSLKSSGKGLYWE